MNTIANTGSATTILAFDLGKDKSVACSQGERATRATPSAWRNWNFATNCRRTSNQETVRVPLVFPVFTCWAGCKERDV